MCSIEISRGWILSFCNHGGLENIMGYLKKITITVFTLIGTVVISGILFALSGRFIKSILSKNYLTQVLVGKGPIIGYNADGIPMYEEISTRGLFYYFATMVFIIMLTYIFYRILIKKRKKKKIDLNTGNSV